MTPQRLAVKAVVLMLLVHACAVWLVVEVVLTPDSGRGDKRVSRPGMEKAGLEDQTQPRWRLRPTQTLLLERLASLAVTAVLAQ